MAVLVGNMRKAGTIAVRGMCILRFSQTQTQMHASNVSGSSDVIRYILLFVMSMRRNIRM